MENKVQILTSAITGLVKESKVKNYLWKVSLG